MIDCGDLSCSFIIKQQKKRIDIWKHQMLKKGGLNT